MYYKAVILEKDKETEERMAEIEEKLNYAKERAVKAEKTAYERIEIDYAELLMQKDKEIEEERDA